jgi:hypothetical protein
LVLADAEIERGAAGIVDERDAVLAGKPEKTDLKVGFIPISCATPIIMAEPTPPPMPFV